MTDRDDIQEIAEIDFEVGHTSTIRDEPTTEHVPPRTHDWKVFLRSAGVRGDLNCLIKRCVFTLHREFPNPKREIRSTPFSIEETGYGSFDLYIDIFFNTKSDPKKFRIQYDLTLHTSIPGETFRKQERFIKKYRCTFYNPDPDLRQKILMAGGRVRSGGSKTNENDDEKIEDEPLAPVPPISVPKRPFSPVPSANGNNSKKLKVEPTTTNQKKSSPPPPPPPPTTRNEISTKTNSSTMNNKKSQMKSSPMVDDKSIKTSSIKETNSQTNGTTLKIKHETDVKTSLNVVSIEKKEMIPSPSKSTGTNSTKKPLTKSTGKPSIKLETTSNTVNKSPIKNESSPNTSNNSSNSMNTTVLISSLKKIPKKINPPPPPPPPLTTEKRPRSPMTPPSSSLSSRNSDRDSHRYSSKSSNNSKRDRPNTNTPPSTSTSNNSSTSRTSSSSNRSLTKHSTNSSSSSSSNGGGNRGRSRSCSRSRSRSRSRSHNRSSHHSSSSRSHHSSRHSSQQPQPVQQTSKDRSNRYSSPSSSSSLQHNSSTGKSSSSHNNTNHHRRVTSSKSTRSPSRSGGSSQADPLLSFSTEPSTVSSSINTPQSRPDSVEPAVVASTTCSPATHVFQNDDDHTQTPMDIDGQTDEDEILPNQHQRPVQFSDEHDQQSPSSTAFVPQQSIKINYRAEHSHSLSDTNESTADSDPSSDDDDDFPSVLTNEELRSKLIFIYRRFTSNTNHALATFVKFFKRHQLIDTSTLTLSKSNDDMFTYDLFSLTPCLIGELASDLGYDNNTTTTNNTINQIEQ